MHFPRVLVRWITLAAAMACPASHAASFDCHNGALTRVEKMICGRDDLGRLDSEMAQAYRRAQALAREPNAVTASQRRWLVSRNQCADAECVARAYRDRLGELRRAPMATWLDFRDPATRLHFRYLGNRSVSHCATDPGTTCFQLAGPGMAYGSEYFLRFELVKGSLETVAGSLWEKEGAGWFALGRGGARSPVEPFAGEGWQGWVANTICGISDENGFHGAAGECRTYLMSDGQRTLIMSTDGASGNDPETLVTIRSARIAD